MKRHLTLLLAVVGITAGLGAIPAAAQEPAPAADGVATVGLVDPTQGRWYLRDGLGATTSFFYGNPGDVPFMGDWNCDGVDTPGLYRQSDGFVYLRNSNSVGVADREFFFGNPGDVPVAGDFDGDGCDTVSIYRPAISRFYVINTLGSRSQGLGAAEFEFTFGDPGDRPLVADLDGDGADEVALHRPSTGLVFYRNDLGHGTADVSFTFGDPGDHVFAGDWDRDGVATVGVFRPGPAQFLLRNANAAGQADVLFSYGGGYLLPVAGAVGALPGGGQEPPTGGGALARGDRGPRVEQLQQALAAKGFYRGPTDGAYGPGTQQAVMAFHKVNRLPREWDWRASDWDRLAAYRGPDNLPSRPGEPDRFEVDLTRQVAHLVKGGKLIATFTISSGNGELFQGSTGSLVRARTPRGNYRFQRSIDGMRISYLGQLWRPWYFVGGYAIHGSPSVPAYPASHGCVRLTMSDANWVFGKVYVGMPIHVWD